MKLTESKLRSIIREELSRLSEARGDDRMNFGQLKDKFDGSYMTRKRGGQLWDTMTDKIVQQTDVDDRYMNNFQAIYFKNPPRGGDVTTAGEIWGSFDNPRESMTPTEHVTFHRIYP